MIITNAVSFVSFQDAIRISKYYSMPPNRLGTKFSRVVRVVQHKVTTKISTRTTMINTISTTTTTKKINKVGVDHRIKNNRHATRRKEKNKTLGNRLNRVKRKAFLRKDVNYVARKDM